MILLRKEDVENVLTSTPGVGKRALDKLETIEPVEAIPVSWIEVKIEWLKSLDSSFSDMTALNIKTMLNQWRKEQKTECNGDYCPI